MVSGALPLSLNSVLVGCVVLRYQSQHIVNMHLCATPLNGHVICRPCIGVIYVGTCQELLKGSNILAPESRTSLFATLIQLKCGDGWPLVNMSRCSKCGSTEVEAIQCYHGLFASLLVSYKKVNRPVFRARVASEPEFLTSPMMLKLSHLAFAFLLGAVTTVKATRHFEIINNCPFNATIYINGQSQGALPALGGSTTRDFPDNWSGLIYTDLNRGNPAGPGTTRAGFYGPASTSWL